MSLFSLEEVIEGFVICDILKFGSSTILKCGLGGEGPTKHGRVLCVLCQQDIQI